jgi:hypothetical protein
MLAPRVPTGEKHVIDDRPFAKIPDFRQKWRPKLDHPKKVDHRAIRDQESAEDSPKTFRRGPVAPVQPADKIGFR